MATWTKEELSKIAHSDDLHVAPLRDDAVTYGTPTWIWSVVVDDALYIRAYNGTSSRWYRAALRQKAGRISAAGMTKGVTFEPAARTLDDRIDAAYRDKYGSSPYLAPMISAGARAATMKVAPRALETAR